LKNPKKTSVNITKVYKEESVTWTKSKSSKKSSSQPEQVEYGELVATKNGIDVTDQILSKPVYIYAYPDIGVFTSSFSTPPEYSIDINVYKDSSWESYDEALEASDSITKRTQYKTYGEVCEALEECILEMMSLD
jgi:hypothetical protein